jgi:K+-transporting ATPase ATPase C chain
MLGTFRPALIVFGALTLVTGVAYPLLVTGIAQVAFPKQANGSLVLRDGKPVGSELIGQPFTSAGYFWSRPSATGPFAYNAAASSGSNLGPTSAGLRDSVRSRITLLESADASVGISLSGPVPVDLATASGSGLDPHIRRAAAEYQVARVARARGLEVPVVRELVAKHTQERQLGFLGEPCVNVMLLNLALDHTAGAAPAKNTESRGANKPSFGEP